MSPRRLRAIVRRVVAEVRRDRPSLALLFIAPIIITGLLTYILREGDTPDVKVVLVNQGPPQAGIRSLGVLDGAGIDVTDATDEATARARVLDGSASLAIVLPADAATGGVIQVITLGLDPLADSANLGAVGDALTDGPRHGVGRRAAGPPTGQHLRHGQRRPDGALRAGDRGLLPVLLRVPADRRELPARTDGRDARAPDGDAGHARRGRRRLPPGFGLFATVQVAILLSWALGSVHVSSVGPLPAFSLGLGIPVAGSPAIAFLVVVLLGLGAISLGIFLSTFARTELQVIQFIPVVLVPQFLLSGVLFPIDSLPAILQPLVALMPLHYAVDALRLVFIQGADLSNSALAGDIGVLALIAVLFAVVASLTIRRDVV